MQPKYPLIAAGLAFAASANAQTIWNGSANSDWFDDANWSLTSPTANDDAQFPTPVAGNQPNIGTGDRMRSLDFLGAGWTISSTGGTGLIEIDIEAGSPAYDVSSSGAGLNVINGSIDFVQAYETAETFVDTGNTLVVNGDIIKPNNRDLIFHGPGKYVVNGNATGAIVVDAGADGLTPTGSYLLNGNTSVQVAGQNREAVINPGNSFGGNVPVVRIFQYQELAFQANSTLSPGGDGATIGVDGYDGGDRISTMMFESTSATIRAAVIMDSASTIEMDIGNTAGENDSIVVGFLTSDFNLGGSTLALVNEGGIVAGSYTLFEETLAGSDVVGTFGNVTLNGDPLPPDMTLEYNTAGDLGNITLVVVPEPGAVAALLGLSAFLLTLRRRRRRQ